MGGTPSCARSLNQSNDVYVVNIDPIFIGLYLLHLLLYCNSTSNLVCIVQKQESCLTGE